MRQMRRVGTPMQRTAMRASQAPQNDQDYIPGAAGFTPAPPAPSPAPSQNEQDYMPGAAPAQAPQPTVHNDFDFALNGQDSGFVKPAPAPAPEASAPAAPAGPVSGSPEAAQDAWAAERDKLRDDILALNETARGDILKQGGENFGSMQRAAMAAAGRFGGGVGGAVLSTQGDMLRQATKGMSDALAANSGQRQTIMGNYMDNRWQDARGDLGYARDVETRKSEADADELARGTDQDLTKAANMAATQIKEQTGQSDETGWKDPQLQGLYNDVKAGKPGAQQALDEYLNSEQRQYVSWLSENIKALTKNQFRDAQAQGVLPNNMTYAQYKIFIEDLSAEQLRGMVQNG